LPVFQHKSQDVAKKFGPGYIDLIASLETKNIMDNVSQTLLELDTYKDEFQKANIAKRGIKHIIGNSAIMKDLKNKLLCISESNSSVLLTGESGTGKELFAQASILTVSVPQDRLLRSTVQPYRKICWNRNYSVMWKGPLPEPAKGAKWASLNWPTRVLFL
jgi:hypothetical protein